MVTTTALVGVALISLAMVLTPGPNMMYLISRSISQGKRAGLISLLGIACGFVVYLLAACVGLVAIFTLVPSLYVAIKIIGAIYLLWLAWKIVKPGGKSVFHPQQLLFDSKLRLWFKGLLTTLLNPKIAIMYVALLPQFINVHKGNVSFQSLLLGSLQISISLSVDALIVLVAAQIAVFLKNRPNWMRLQRYITGALLPGFALRIATAAKSTN